MRRRTGLEDTDLFDKVIKINRVAKVVKGGRRFSFTAIVVVGDKKGKVGVAKGKANEVPEAIRKAIDRARKSMTQIPLVDTTIPYEVLGRYGAGRVLLKPASLGTGVIAGGPVRAVLEVAGIQNVLTKSIGTSNAHNMVKATMQGLLQLQDAEAIARRRGRSVEDISG